VEYFTDFPLNQELQFTNTLGRDLPLIAWNSMPEAATKGLEYADFKSAVVSFKNGTFSRIWLQLRCRLRGMRRVKFSRGFLRELCVYIESVFLPG
jgi:hypothetical protein